MSPQEVKPDAAHTVVAPALALPLQRGPASTNCREGCTKGLKARCLDRCGSRTTVPVTRRACSKTRAVKPAPPHCPAPSRPPCPPPPCTSAPARRATRCRTTTSTSSPATWTSRRTAADTTISPRRASGKTHSFLRPEQAWAGQQGRHLC